MSTIRRRTLDPTLELETSPPDHADLHVLRLALDLQVDAMLLTLGAAARADDETVPWRRWVLEDLDAARLLAQAVIAENVEPPAALGSGVVGAAADGALEDLIARYTAMDDLLHGVLRRPHAGQAWRPAARDTLTRCRSRLDELHRHRGELAARRAAARPQFLPGELLG